MNKETSKIIDTMELSGEVLDDYKSMDIRELPDEILLKIFDYLPTCDVFKRVALVCKRFYRLTKEPILVKEIYLTSQNSVKMDSLFEILKRPRKQKATTSIVFCLDDHGVHWDDLYKCFRRMDKYCPNLQYIEIRDVSEKRALI